MSTESDVQEQLSNFLSVLEQYNPESSRSVDTNGEVSADADLVKPETKQFLFLWSTVNGATQVLFSGLQNQSQVEKVKSDGLLGDVDSALPKGFELGDFSTLGGEEGDSRKQEKRTFEKVFTTLRRLKTLDLPHQAKDVVRGNTLDFIPYSSRIENLPVNKHDYKYARLPTGSWLSYRQSSQTPRLAHQTSIGADFKAALTANNVRQGKDINEEELFSSVYSSFAPNSDNAYSLVANEDWNRQWWSHHGEQKLNRLFRPINEGLSVESGGPESSDEFADMVANFEPQDTAEVNESLSTDKEIDALLEEVSDMIETLSSYQRNRSLDIVASGKVQKPDKPEFDTFEMLRNQLTILIASLPPFAVAKLNGDQLEELNISTRLVVEVPDYPGSGQPDDYLLRREKVAQQATQAASRPTATPHPVRPNYSSVQANTASYNSQLRKYNSVPAAAAYGMRAAQSYNTPTTARPTYSQTPTFQAPTTNPAYSANRPTIQQFQRPTIQNSYGSYGSSTPLQPSQQQSQTQTPGTLRPTQAGYQQRAQDAALLARSASPQNPQSLVNGAGQQYTQRPPQQSQSQTAAQQLAYARQSSGTPSTPIAPATATMAARYDGATNRPISAQSPGNARHNTTPQAQPSASQTVEVMR